MRHAPGRRAGAVATRGDGRGDESDVGTAAGGVRKEEAASDIEEGRAEAGLRVGEGDVATGEAVRQLGAREGADQARIRT